MVLGPAAATSPEGRALLLGGGLDLLVVLGAPVAARARVAAAEDLVSLGTILQEHVDAQLDPEHQATELERARADLQLFAYAASHELQEPLRMVASYTELLCDEFGDQLDPQARRYLDFAHDGARRMQRLLADLLTYSRIQSRGGPLRPVSADAAVDGALEALGAEVRRTHATIARAPLPAVLADERQLVQLFEALLSNAMTFAGAAPPQVRIDCTPPDPAQFAGGGVEIRVTDGGLGFDMRHAERIFDVFQRLHTRDEIDGTGMGLAIARRIVERHGGRISAVGEPGRGATVRFTLPVAGEGP
ncbi:MAG: ATP-binding protein [Myxococcota bacterium]